MNTLNSQKVKIFTKDEKESRRQLLDEIKQSLNVAEYISNVLGLTIVQMKKGERYLKTKELSSLVIDLKINKVYWNKYGSKPMDVIDFIVHYNNCSYTQAIGEVVDYYKERDPNVIELYNYDPLSDKTYTSQGISLPAPYTDDERATYYLMESRRISEDIINKLREKNMFYEDIYHNCVFVGYDSENKPRFGVRRGTNASVKFQRDCSGSYKNCGLFIENKFPVKKLVITECVIDGLSYLSLNKDLVDAHVLCSSGAGCLPNTLWFNLNTRDALKNITEVVCATDNDEAGRYAYKQVKAYLQENRPDVKLTLFRSYDGLEMKQGEDLNDLLKKVREKEENQIIENELEEEQEMEV